MRWMPAKCLLAGLLLPLVFQPLRCAAQTGASMPGPASPAPDGAAQPQVETTPGTPAANGQPGQPTYTIRRNVRLVVLDAVVVDAKGNAVTDLTRNDFHITEDGDAQQLRNFAHPGQFTPPAESTIDSTAQLDQVAPRAPVNIILLDEFNTLFEDQAFARYSLKKFLDAQPDKLDTPTMLVAVSLQKFVVLRDYTQNKEELLTALDKHFAGYPWQAQGGQWLAERFSLAFAVLGQVADATAGHPGHKNMIWIGRGFPTINLARFTTDGRDRLNSVVQETIDKLRNARVTLYTIDPAGVMTDPGKYGVAAAEYAPFGGDPTFQALARSTGGRNLYGRNDVDAEIGKSIRDGRSFYTLTYYPTNDNRDPRQFRKISVTVDRPGLTVVTRPGYYVEHRPARVGKEGQVGRYLASQLIGAERNNLVYDAVKFTVSPEPAKPMTYSVLVEPHSVPWYTTSPRSAKLEVMVTSFDKKGKEIARTLRLDSFQAKADAPASGPLDMAIHFSAEVPPDPKGKAQVARARIVLRMEATGRMGTADVTLGDNATVHSNVAPEPGTTPVPASPPSPATTPQP